MSNINLPRVPPAKPSAFSGQGRKLLIVAALVAAGALLGGRAISSRRTSAEAPASETRGR